jgi:hypothetical protein
MGTIVGIVIALFLVVCLLFAGGCSRPSTIDSPPVVTMAGMKSLDRAAIKAMLKKLVDSPPPKDLKSGAMCYKPMQLPIRADYVCPKCGERTLYDATKLKNVAGMPHVVEWEIPSCRREFQLLRKVAGDAIAFDESQFCKKCAPKVTNPKLILRITFTGEPTRTIDNLTADDLRILRDFLTGRFSTTNTADWELPLKESLPRLQELLGVKLDEPAK